MLLTTAPGQILDRFNTGEMIGFGTFDSDPFGQMRSDVVKDHVYAMVGYGAYGRFKLFNPHGINAGDGEAGILYLTWSEMLVNFASWDYTHG